MLPSMMERLHAFAATLPAEGAARLPRLSQLDGANAYPRPDARLERAGDAYRLKNALTPAVSLSERTLAEVEATRHGLDVTLHSGGRYRLETPAPRLLGRLSAWHLAAPLTLSGTRSGMLIVTDAVTRVWPALGQAETAHGVYQLALDTDAERAALGVLAGQVRAADRLGETLAPLLREYTALEGDWRGGRDDRDPDEASPAAQLLAALTVNAGALRDLVQHTCRFDLAGAEERGVACTCPVCGASGDV